MGLHDRPEDAGKYVPILYWADSKLAVRTDGFSYASRAIQVIQGKIQAEIKNGVHSENTNVSVSLIYDRQPESCFNWVGLAKNFIKYNWLSMSGKGIDRSAMQERAMRFVK